MSDMLNRIAELIGNGLVPLVQRLSDTDSGVRAAALLDLGYVGPFTDPSALTALNGVEGAVVDALIDLQQKRLDADANGASTGQIATAEATLFGAVLVLVGGIHLVAVTIQPAFPDFETRIYGRALADGLASDQRVLLAFLRIAGIIQVDQIAIQDDPNDAEAFHVVDVPSFHADRLLKWFQDPKGVLADVYGWGTPAVDVVKFYTNLQGLLRGKTRDSIVGFAAGNVLQACGVTLSADGHELIHQLAIPLVDFSVGDLFLDVLPLPTTDPSESQALGLVLDVGTSLSSDVQINQLWKLSYVAKADVASGFAVILRPGANPTIVGNVFAASSSQIAADVRVEVSRTAPTGTSGTANAQVLGIGSGSSIQAGVVRLFVAATTRGKSDVLFGISVESGQAVLSAEQADGFLGSILQGQNVKAKFDAELDWSRTSGVRFKASGGLRLTLPLSFSVGGFSLDELDLEVDVSGGVELIARANVSAKLGPVTASVEGVGAHIDVSTGSGNLGLFDVNAGFIAPTGLGIAIDAGSVHGGGFISFDPDAGRYSGALQLSIYDIAVNAFGLIETKVPGVSYSFVIVISAEFTPIQLGFGFTLNGVGGIVGINRGIDTNALASLVRAGQSENLLFPKNVVADAPTIVRDLTSVFPATQGRYVFGPLGKLGWGTPTLITGEFGIILEIPGPVVVILGEVKCVLPKPDAALVKFNLSIDGELDFPNKRFAMDAALHDSVINGFPVSGQMAMRVTWGDQPNFVFSIGGFHPAYTPPSNFPKLQPLALDLGKQGAATITVSGFFAVTSNTVQVGGQARLHAGGGGISLDASVSVKALFVFSPFSFEADIDASVKISFHGYGPSVHLSGMLKGPSPWRVKGRVCVSILWWDACLGFDVTFGNNQPESQPELDPWVPADSAIVGLKAALSDTGNWSGAALPGAVSSVTRAQGTDTLLDPVGGLTVRQKVAPVETPHPLTKFGVAKVPKPVSFSNVQATLGDTGGVSLTAASPINEYFAPAQFFDMGDAKKLSSPGFEQYQAGYLFATAANPKNVQAGSNAPKTLSIQTFVIGSDGSETQVEPPYIPSNAHVTGTNQRSAVAKLGLTLAGTRRFINRTLTQAFIEKVLTYVIASNSTLKAVSGAPVASERSAALIALDTFRAQNVEQAAGVQVAATHELAA
jgi:hypothetical protein